MSRLAQLMRNYGVESEGDAELLAESGVVADPSEELAETEALAEVEQSEQLSEQLETLAEHTEDAPDEVSVEHFHWVFDTLLKNAGFRKPKALGLENFNNSDSGKVMLARSIRRYNKQLRTNIKTARANIQKQFG